MSTYLRGADSLGGEIIRTKTEKLTNGRIDGK